MTFIIAGTNTLLEKLYYPQVRDVLQHNEIILL